MVFLRMFVRSKG